MAHSSDNTAAHEYTSFDGEVAAKKTWKPSLIVGSLTVMLGASFVLMGYFASDRQRASGAAEQMFSGVAPKRFLTGSSVGSLPRGVARPPPLAAARDVSRAAEPKYTPLLAKLGKKKIVTGLSKAGVLSGAEKAGAFSKLEKAGAFSTAEKLLPLTDQLGALQFLQGAVDSKPAELATQGTALAALGPIYAALASQGLMQTSDFPLVLLPGALFTGTTVAGVSLLALSAAVGQLQEPGTADGKTSPIPLLGTLGAAKAGTIVAESGLLSDFEKAGTFSSLEKSGALSTVEKLLPTIDSLGLLPFLQSTIDTKPQDLATTGTAIIALGPIYSGLVNEGILPNAEGPLALLPALLLTATTASGVLLIGTSALVDQLKNPQAVGGLVKTAVGAVKDPISAALDVAFSPGYFAQGAVDKVGEALGFNPSKSRFGFVGIQLFLFLFLGAAVGIKIATTEAPL